MSPVMTWRDYVREIAGEDTGAEIARRSNLDPATVSRWLNPDNPKTPSAEAVRDFARGYGVPVLAAFVAAGHLTEEEARRPSEEERRQAALRALPVEEIATELGRRLGVEP